MLFALFSSIYSYTLKEKKRKEKKPLYYIGTFHPFVILSLWGTIYFFYVIIILENLIRFLPLLSERKAHRCFPKQDGDHMGSKGWELVVYDI